MSSSHHITVAICTYNRAHYLPQLVNALRQQRGEIEFDILFVNNNSNDHTLELIQGFCSQPGVPIRVVTETRQGIVHARNRAISECLNADFMLVMDDDEIPSPNWVASAYTALKNGDTDCVGGQVDVCFDRHTRPKWLGDELLGFLAEINYGDKAFVIDNEKTPVWTANIAYNMKIFKNNPGLRFDKRYNREGEGVGGGEDFMMFKTLLARGHKIKYAPTMVVYHHIEPWRLTRRYFYTLHFTSGKRAGTFDLHEYSKNIAGVPTFLFSQILKQTLKTIWMFLFNHPKKIRQGMNTSYALGLIFGAYQRRNDQL